MISALSLALGLSACAQLPASDGAVGAPRVDAVPASPSHCEAARACDAIGQLPLAGVVDAARKAAAAEVVRTLRQGQPITKEFRVGRLNLVLDAEGRIASANCS
jgi:hypothetical protein